MKRSLIAVAFLSCLAFASAAVSAFADVVVTAYRAAKGFVFQFVEVLAAPTVAEIQRPAVPHARAKSFLGRMMRRVRPTVTPGWRMCPST